MLVRTTCRGVPERVHPFSNGICRNIYDFCAPSQKGFVLEAVPPLEELEARAVRYTCRDIICCRCCWYLCNIAFCPLLACFIIFFFSHLLMEAYFSWTASVRCPHTSFMYSFCTFWFWKNVWPEIQFLTVAFYGPRFIYRRILRAE
jgi:hypothetical protein